jgi:hypothetical protein
MPKVEITRTEAIPFREADGTIMQMKQYEVTVKVIQQEESETIEDIEKELDIIFNRNLEKTLAKDPVYIKQKLQLNFLVDQLKIIAPTKARDLIFKAKQL